MVLTEKWRCKFGIISLLRLALLGTIKPSAYKAFVVTKKAQKRLKSKQRQQEQRWLLSRAYLSFGGSFYYSFCFYYFRLQIYRINLIYATKIFSSNSW